VLVRAFVEAAGALVECERNFRFHAADTHLNQRSDLCHACLHRAFPPRRSVASLGGSSRHPALQDRDDPDPRQISVSATTLGIGAALIVARTRH
jgi:hypothetical protein